MCVLLLKYTIKVFKTMQCYSVTVLIVHLRICKDAVITPPPPGGPIVATTPTLE